MAPIDDPAQLKVLDENFLDLLRTVWDGTRKVLDIGTGRGRVAVSIAKEFPEVQVTGVDIWTKMSSVFGLTKEGKGYPRTSGKGRAAWRRGCATQNLQRGRYGHGRAL